MNVLLSSIAHLKRPLFLGVIAILLGIALMGGSCDKTTGPMPDSGVSGTVLDSATGLPIDSALVEAPSTPDTSIIDTFWMDYSDTTGAFDVRLHIFGWNYVRCSKPGYMTDSIRVYYGGTVVNNDIDFLLLVPE